MPALSAMADRAAAAAGLEFVPSPPETLARAKRSWASPKTLLVTYEKDDLDQNAQLAATLAERAKAAAGAAAGAGAGSGAGTGAGAGAGGAGPKQRVRWRCTDPFSLSRCPRACPATHVFDRTRQGHHSLTAEPPSLSFANLQILASDRLPLPSLPLDPISLLSWRRSGCRETT